MIASTIRHAIEDARFEPVVFTYLGVSVKVDPRDEEVEIYQRWNEARRERDKATWFAGQREAVRA